MLRVACRSDIDRVYVVRADDVTVIYRPAVYPIRDLLAALDRLLTDEEHAIVRCANEVTAATATAQYLARYPDVVCPCATPRQFRHPFDQMECPLHVPLAALVD